MPYSDQKYSGYQAKLVCGHGRRIKYGSFEDLRLIERGVARCGKCQYEVAVVGWTSRGPLTPSNGDRVEKAGAHSSWIDLAGTVYYVGDAQHYSTAIKMGSDMDSLERQGWVHFSYTGIHVMREVTESQRSALWDHLMAFEALEAEGKKVYNQSDYLRHLRRMFQAPVAEPAYNPDDLWS